MGLCGNVRIDIDVVVSGVKLDYGFVTGICYDGSWCCDGYERMC